MTIPQFPMWQRDRRGELDQPMAARFQPPAKREPEEPPKPPKRREPWPPFIVSQIALFVIILSVSLPTPWSIVIPAIAGCVAGFIIGRG